MPKGRKANRLTMGSTKKTPDNGNNIGSSAKKSTVRPASEQEEANRRFDAENAKIFDNRKSTGGTKNRSQGTASRRTPPRSESSGYKPKTRTVSDTHGPAQHRSSTNTKPKTKESSLVSSDPFDPFGEGSKYGDGPSNIRSVFDRPERPSRTESGGSPRQESRSRKPQGSTSSRSSASDPQHTPKPKESISSNKSSSRRDPSDISRSKRSQGSSIRSASGERSTVKRASSGASSSISSHTSSGKGAVKRAQSDTHRSSSSSQPRSGAPRAKTGSAAPAEEESIFEIPEFIKNFPSRAAALFSKKEKTKKEKKKRDPKKTLKIILASLGVFLVAALIAGVCIYNSIVESTFKDLIIEEVNTDWKDDPHSDLKGIPSKGNTSKVTNILFLGIDDNGGKGCRSDTVMIASITDRGLKLTSILRDNYVFVPGHGRTKLNHAYAYGGAALTMQTIESNYRLHIDEYVSVSMEDLGEIVRAAGGVTIEITDAEAKEINNFLGCNIGSGVQRLTPDQAVYFSRIRRIDSDFGRTERQRKLMFAVLDECLNMSYPQMFSFVKSVCPYLKTNMQPKRIASLALKAFPHAKEPIGELHLPMDSTYSFEMVSGMSVIQSNMKENVTLLWKFIYG